MALNSYNSRLSRTTSSHNVRPGVYHRGLNTLTKLSGPAGSRGPAVPARNLPRPVQTSSLKKENGGQDITAVLVNRDGGKKVGWGSSLPEKPPETAPSGSLEPTPADASALLEGKSKSGDEPLKATAKNPPLPPPPTDSNKNVPWALHPPSQQPNADMTERSSSPKSEYPPLTENGYSDRYGDRHGYRDYHSDPRSSARMGRADNRHEWNGDPQNYRDGNNYRRYPSRNDNYIERDRHYNGRGDYNRNDYYRGERGGFYGDRDYRDRDFRTERGDYRDHSDNRYYDGPRHDHRNRENYGSYRYMRERGNDRYSRDRYHRGDDRRARDDGNGYHRRESYDNESRDWRDPPRNRFSEPSSPGRNEHSHNHENDSRRYPVYAPHPDSPDVDHRRFDHTDNVDHPSNDTKTPLRNSNGPNRSYGSPVNNEDDVVIQSIREREAAEMRVRLRKKKEDEKPAMDMRAESAEEYNTEKEENIAEFKPTVLRRNIQTSDEEPTDATAKQEVKTEEVELDSSHQPKASSETEINDTKDIETKSHKTELEKESNQMSTLSKDSSKPASLTSNSETVHEQSNEFDNMPENTNEAIKNDCSLAIQEVNDNIASETESENENEIMEEEPKSQETLRLEQQQKVLRRVEATRAKHSKPNIKNETNSSEEKSIPDKVAKVNENESVSNTTSEIEQKTKTRRPVPQPPKKNGPRTRGVLFKRLPDGSIVNADLSDEELAKRAERKGRKNYNSRSKHNPATKGTESEKSDGESLCSEKKDTGDLHNDCESKETAETDDSKKKNDSEEKNEITQEKTCSQRKEFVPSPGPVVSAWKAGPPPGMVKTHTKSHTKEQPHPQQLSIKSNESNNSSKMTQILNTRLVDVTNNSESWVGSKDDGTNSTPKYAAVAPIMNPSWNAFSGSAAIPNSSMAIFTAGKDNGTNVSPDWSIPAHESDASKGVIQWRPAETQEEEEDAAALTDGSDAVPRDLLSSTAGSENECDAEVESKNAKMPYKSKLKNTRKNNYVKYPKDNGRFNKRIENGRKKTFPRRPKSFKKDETATSTDDREDKSSQKNFTRKSQRKFPSERNDGVPKPERLNKEGKNSKAEAFRRARNSTRPRGKFSKKVDAEPTPPEI